MKLERAKQQLAELEHTLKTFYDGNPYKFSGARL
jgi:hypothetical protein